MRWRSRILSLGTSALAAAMLAASCGGSGDDGDPTPAPSPPATASQDAAATATGTTQIPVATSATLASSTASNPAATATPARPPSWEVREYPVPPGSAPHDVAPAPEGIWFTAQRSGQLGLLDPGTGESHMVPLGAGSAPHGVIVGPDGAAWVTDGGLNAIVRVDQRTFEVKSFPLPASHPRSNLNTATFDNDGILWFTGQAGVFGSVDPATAEVRAYSAPRGTGPYGITTTPSGDVYYASLAGSHIARIDRATGAATVIEPPTPRQGARRVWSDSRGRIWVSEWNSGQASVYDPSTNSWDQWKLPGARPQTYAVYVDDDDYPWFTDFGGNAIVRFDPETETFESFPMSKAGANVRQLLGRPGEVWGAQSALDALVVIAQSE